MLNTIIDRKNSYHSNGYSAVGMVMVLLLLGGMLMSELNRFSLSWQKKELKTHQYYHEVNHVLSSISWAVTLQWHEPTEQWQCQTEYSLQLTACIRKALLSTGDYVLIKGQYGQTKQYHLATYEHQSLTIEKGHWLDYCIGNKEDNCE